MRERKGGRYMDKKMNFKYFYGTEADQFSFYRIPKALFSNDCFKDLSSDAKILYGLMLDRMSLSIKNQWFDEENRAYIYFSIEDIMELLNCGRNKAVKSLQELDDEKGIGLIEKRRQGFGKVTIIYVKSFIQEECEEQKKEKPKMVKFTNQTSVEEEETEEVYISNFKKSQKQTSRSPENKLQEVYISNSNNTNINNTSGKPRNWMATDDIIIDGKQFYLMEHQEYHRQVAYIILDSYGKMIMEECQNGFDEKTKQKLHELMKTSEQREQEYQKYKERLEHYQKFFENGTYERSWESGTEENYNMVDGQVNNLKSAEGKRVERKPAQSPEQSSKKKPKKRESVIKRLREKQIAIAVKSGKPVPRYLEQDMERRRG